MLPQTVFESKQDDAGVVKRQDQEDTTDDKHQETHSASVTTRARTSCDSAPVMVSWIIVSIATILFLICIVVFKIWKKMAQDLEDKSILVEHEGQKSDIPENRSEGHVNKTEATDVSAKDEKNSDAECTDEDTPLIDEDTFCNTKIEEIKEHDVAEFPSENNVEKTICAADCRQEENSEVLSSSPATQHVPVSQSKLEDLKVSPADCDATSKTLEEDLRSKEMATKLYEPQKKVVAENVTFQNYVSENQPAVSIDCMQRRSSDNLAMMGATLKTLSPSLQYLAEIHQPKDIPDGSLLSKHDDMFIFPLDDDLAMVNKSEPPSQTDTKPKKKLLQNADSEFSKSLDSQKRILEKGSKLFKTKPLKSSLRRSGSDGCLEKNVHFPEDIRDMRTVHKYDSCDEGIWLKFDGDKTEKEANNVED